jgi:hypothetical protein
VEWELLPEKLKTLSVKKGRLFNAAGKAHHVLAQWNAERNPDELVTADVEVNATLAGVVVNSFDEVQLIWNELDYFRLHRKIKGEHPDLIAAEKKAELSTLSDVALLKLLRNRPADILKYTRTRIPAAANEERRRAMEEKVEAWKAELEAARVEAKKRRIVS